MKLTTFLLAVFAIFYFFPESQAQSEQKVTANNLLTTNEVTVYYFHHSRRCVTCNAVETVSREALKEFYGNKVTLKDLNIDEAEGKAKGKELGVSGQTLLIVSGDTKVNLTNEGFMNARSNPERLKQILKSKIDPLL